MEKDAGTVKAKVVIEYDPEGIDKAKEDLASLADAAGGVGESTGSAADGLAALDEQAGKSASSAKSFTEALGELPKITEESASNISDMNEVLDESRRAFDDTGSAAEETASRLQKTAQPMQVISDHAQALSDKMNVAGESFAQVQQTLSASSQLLPQYAEGMQSIMDSLPARDQASFVGANEWQDAIAQFTTGVSPAGNLQVFQSALEDPAPFEMIQDHLNATGQTWEAFDTSIGKSNAQMLSTMRENSAVSYDVLDTMNQGFGNVAVSAQDADKAVAEFLGTGAQTGKTGGDWWSGQAESLFGGGGIMGILNDVAMPLMAVQMIGMAVGQMGQGIYNAAAIAEGPAAHGVGTFTGAIDTLTASANKAGQSFSESFGQGVLPALNAVNSVAAQSQGGFDFWGNLGQGLGMEVGIVGDLAQVVGGSLAPDTALGQGMFDAGSHGLANYWANWTGQAEPYPGPTPPSQSQIAYQQSMANMPNTIAMSASQMQTQATTTLAEATDPNWLAAQNQLSASQRAAQYLIQQYDSRHPQSQYDLIQQAQYEEYAAQQQMNYQAQIGGGGGIVSGQAPSTPLDFLTGMGPASVGGFQGQGGETWGQSIGKGIQDFFSSNGAGGQAMQFLTGFGGNTGGGQTYGQSIGGFFGGIGADIGGFFGGIGNLFSGGSAPITSTGGGCFPAGTRVLMVDGSEKPIETLQIGEQVQSHDGTKQVHATITDCITFAAKQTYRLVFSDGNVLFTTDSHPLASLQGWKSIDPASTAVENPGLPVTTLEVGDMIYTVDGSFCQLLSLQKHEITTVYNITVDTFHIYYANNVLVHNAKLGAMSNSGEGSENVSLSHNFVATVTWEAQNLEKQFTAAAQWIGQGLTNTFQGVANWVAQGLSNTFQGVANWIGQGLENTFQGVANWIGQGLENTFQGVANWIGDGLDHLFTGKAAWIGQDLEHMFTAVAQWTAQNLNPSFTVNPSVTMLAEGASNFAGGPAIVAEAGYPEVVEHNGQYSLFQGATLLDLPAGANVYPMKNLSSSSVAQFADGTDGPTIPLTFGASGGSMPQSVSIVVQLDSQSILSAIGMPMAQNIRLASGMRGF